MRAVRILLAFTVVCVVAVPAISGDDAKPAQGTMRELRSIKSNRGWAGSLEFSPDGKELLTIVDTQITLWDAATGKELRRVGVEKDSVSFVAYSCQGRTLAASINLKHSVQFYEAASLKPQGSIEFAQPILGVAVSSRDKVVAASVEGKIWLVEAPSAKVLRTIPLKKYDRVGNMAFSPDGKTLVACIHNIASNHVRQEVALYDVATGKQTRSLPLPATAKEHADRLSKWPGQTAFSEATGLFALGMQYDLVLPLWDLARPSALRQLDWTFRLTREMREEDRIPDKSIAAALCFSRDGKTLLVGCQDRKIRIWETATAKLRHTVDSTASQLAVSTDGSILATSCREDKAIRLWDWRDIGDRRVKVSAESLPGLWADLASEDATIGFRAVSSLLSAPKQAVELLGQRLSRVEPVSEAEVRRLIARLDDGEYKVRDEARLRLEVLGRVAEYALRLAAKAPPSVEARGSIDRLLSRLDVTRPEQLRSMRSVEVLEAVGTVEARKVLERLAGGAAGADLTVDAKAALARLSKRTK